MIKPGSSRILLAIVLLGVFGSPERIFAGPTQDAAAYVAAIAKINDAHVRQPARTREPDLAKLLPGNAKSALERVLEAGPAPDLAPALLRCGEAALDLDLLADFEKIRARLTAVAPDAAEKLGTAISRPRFI